ncbi:hypothetical protein LTR37_013458 [Vermiconidia calcicola]|uniref:Uncharacterized protein n=1 Tax=Vermiconidia calcicola TaxID=1690605 RepID=A0ACC3MX22_9PEZI|nr:hypothetical protein LTR37_013458 [Vermiconidia calcicola]
MDDFGPEITSLRPPSPLQGNSSSLPNTMDIVIKTIPTITAAETTLSVLTSTDTTSYYKAATFFPTRRETLSTELVVFVPPLATSQTHTTPLATTTTSTGSDKPQQVALRTALPICLVVVTAIVLTVLWRKRRHWDISKFSPRDYLHDRSLAGEEIKSEIHEVSGLTRFNPGTEKYPQGLGTKAELACHDMPVAAIELESVPAELCGEEQAKANPHPSIGRGGSVLQ